MKKNIYLILLISVTLFSCKSKEKGFSVAKKSHEESLLQADVIFIEAATEKNKGNKDKAIALYQKGLSLPGDKGPIHYELAKLYEEANENEKANFHIGEALKIDATNNWYWKFYIKLGRSENDFNKVEQGYLELIKLNPKDVDYLTELSDIYLAKPDYEKALELYIKIESKIGVTKRINQNKFLIYKNNKKFTEALLELQKLNNAFPLDTDYYLDIADFYIDLNNNKAALESIEKGLEVLPNHPDLLMGKGDYYFHNKEYVSAFANYNQAVLDPGFSDIKKNEIIEGYFINRSRNDTLKQHLHLLLESYSSINPTSFKANIYLAEVFQRLDSLAKTQKHLILALNVDPNSYTTWEFLISIDLYLNDYQLMNNHINEALELFPTQPSLYYFKGVQKQKTAEFDAALKSFNNGLNMVVGNEELKVRFLSAIGDLHNDMGNFAKSDEVFEEVLQINPNDAMVLNNYAYYLSVRKENLEKAKSYSEKSLKLEPENPSYLDTYGWILYQLNQPEEAIQYLLKADEFLKSKNETILEHIIEVYDALNQQNNVKLYRSILSELKKSTL